jgi:hypothetical protein
MATNPPPVAKHGLAVGCASRLYPTYEHDLQINIRVFARVERWQWRQAELRTIIQTQRRHRAPMDERGRS